MTGKEGRRAKRLAKLLKLFDKEEALLKRKFEKDGRNITVASYLTLRRWRLRVFAELLLLEGKLSERVRELALMVMEVEKDELI